MLHLTVRQLVFLAFCCLMIFSKTVLTQDKVWREVTQEELQMKTPKVEADADAEAIFWEVRVNDDFVPRAGFKTLINHYLRIKIFTERGRELNSKVDIPFGKIPDLNINVLIKDIAARTIKPDGTIIEIKPQDIFERDTVKANGVKLKAKSFAMPGIETGAIIEYRWREIRGDSLSYYVRLPLMREIPVHLVKYYIKPVNAPNFYLGMRVHSFNVQNGFEKDKDNYYSMKMRDVPAFREEPRMPSEYTVKSWMLVYYADPLDDNGTLEGDVRIEFTGHLGNYYKEFNDDDSPTEREKTLNEMIKRNILDTAEISGISVENVQDVEKPFAYSFKIRIPNYAERTGKRLFVRPNLFERNTNALFTTNIRKYDISFDYAWSEDDEISIELPPNFIVESAETPSEVRDNRGFGSHETKISFSEDKRTLIYKRKFAFGNNGNLSFYKVAYPAIKQLFETFHKADAYSVSLKQN